MTEWDLKKLRVLRTLADVGTVTAAAEALFMTPSAVSQQLTGLSRQLGVTLLEAHGRRVRLTPAAELVLHHAASVFAELERADAALAGHVRGEAGQVRLGAFSTAIPALVVPAIAALRTTHPDLHICVREAEAAEVYDLLADGVVDLALSLAAHAPPARDARFTHRSVHTDPLDIALPAGHRLAAARSLRLADLADEPWIYGNSGPWSQITTTVCEAAGFVPRQAHAAADWAAILALVGAGLGVALVPRMAGAGTGAAGAARVTVRVLGSDRPRRYVVAATRRGAEEWPGVQRVLDALRNVQLN
ncbi:LysR family transcriptional regulator [Streptomyces albus]|uniref:LysR family transcriptional regulator n=1 Tax=Streptomyces albus TaxID=1888 RepID=UPI0033CF5CC4